MWFLKNNKRAGNLCSPRRLRLCGVIWKSICLLESINAVMIVVKLMRTRNCKLMQRQCLVSLRPPRLAYWHIVKNPSATPTCIIQFSAWATSVKNLTGRHATPDINLAFSPTHLLLTGYFPILRPLFLNPRDGLCVKKITVYQQFGKYSGQPIWHQKTESLSKSLNPPFFREPVLSLIFSESSSARLNSLSRCSVIGWWAVCVHKQFSWLPNKVAGECTCW